MDISKTIAELKKEAGFNDNVGMILVHNGICRGTSRDGHPVTQLEVHPDREKIESIRRECEKLPGIFRIIVQANSGIFTPGDDVLFIIVAGDIRENVKSALAITLDRIKSETMKKIETPA